MILAWTRVSKHFLSTVHILCSHSAIWNNLLNGCFLSINLSEYTSFDIISQANNLGALLDEGRCLEDCNICADTVVDPSDSESVS